MRFVALALFAVAVAVVAAFGSVGHAAAPVPKHLMKEPESDKAKLQGQWKVEAMRMGGEDVLGALGVKFDMVIEFRDDLLLVTSNIGGATQKITATVTYDKGGAKQLRTTNTNAVDANGKPTVGNERDEAFGYAFDGDKLLLATSEGGPKGKGAVDPLKPGPNDVVIVLTRVKK